MRTKILFTLFVSAALTLVACGKNEEPKTAPTQAPTSAPAPSPAPAPAALQPRTPASDMVDSSAAISAVRIAGSSRC